MDSVASPSLLLACAPAIKAEWRRLLRQEPALTALGHPDTLAFLMDATLRELAADLETATAVERRPPAAPLHRACRCGLNPLLKYFATGELALRIGARAALGENFDAALALFQRLAQREIEALCSVCQRRP